MFDLWTRNRAAWDRRVDSGNRWTRLGSSTVISRRTPRGVANRTCQPILPQGQANHASLPQKVCRTLFDSPTFR